MTATITALAQPNNAPPRFQLTVAGASGSTVTITRTDPDGAMRPIRTAEPATLVSGGWVGFDYESPFDPSGTQNVTYMVTPADLSAPFTTTVSALNVSQPWLIHPGVPSLSQPITVLFDDPPETMASGATLHQVIGRSTPVPITDGVRKSRTSQLVVLTENSTQSDSMTALLADTAPLLLQITMPLDLAEGLFPSLSLFPSTSLFPSSALAQMVSSYDWVQVEDVTRDRAGNIFGDPWRRWTMPFQVVDRPAGGIAAERNWADAIAESATWADVMSKYRTWQGLLVGTPGT